jgi:hypothetical protein
VYNGAKNKRELRRKEEDYEMVTKKRLLEVLLLVMFVMVVPTVSVQAASKKDAYKAYSNWLAKEAPKQYKKYTLVKLDGDKVPELIGYYSDEGMDYYIVCAYDGKNVVTQEVQEGVASVGGFRGSLLYMPKKGKIWSNSISAGTGAEYDAVYVLKNGKFKSAASGSSEYGLNGKKQYIWNDKRVSKKNYNKNLKKSFNTSKGKTFTSLKYISKSNMKKKLK